MPAAANSFEELGDHGLPTGGTRFALVGKLPVKHTRSFLEPKRTLSYKLHCVAALAVNGVPRLVSSVSIFILLEVDGLVDQGLGAGAALQAINVPLHFQGVDEFSFFGRYESQTNTVSAIVCGAYHRFPVNISHTFDQRVSCSPLDSIWGEQISLAKNANRSQRRSYGFPSCSYAAVSPPSWHSHSAHTKHSDCWQDSASSGEKDNPIQNEPS